MNYIMFFLYKYGLGAMCFVILIEYACFPISSEIVLPFSGVVAKIYDINLMVLIILSTICGLAGSSICYCIGNKLGDRCIKILVKRFPKSSKAIDKSYDFFDKYGKKAVMIGRIIPLCRTYISFVAGVLKLPYKHFIVYSSLGILVWNTVLIYLGFVLGENWANVKIMYNNYKYIIGVFVGIIVMVLIFLNLKKDYITRRK